MLTIDRLAKIDSLAMRIITALYRGIELVGDHYEARLVDAAYRVAEAKAAAIGKAEDKLANASLALVAANKDYDATVRAANEKLGVEVDA